MQAVEPELLLEPEEQILQARYLLLLPQYRQRLDDLDYIGALELLASLQGPLSCFFEKVLVMSKDTSLRINRLALPGGNPRDSAHGGGPVASSRPEIVLFLRLFAFVGLIP